MVVNYASSIRGTGEETLALIGAVVAVGMILVVLIDAFEVVLLPRRIRHGFRLARTFFRTSWIIGRAAARLLPAGRGAPVS